MNQTFENLELGHKGGHDFVKHTNGIYWIKDHDEFPDYCYVWDQSRRISDGRLLIACKDQLVPFGPIKEEVRAFIDKMRDLVKGKTLSWGQVVPE